MPTDLPKVQRLFWAYLDAADETYEHQFVQDHGLGPVTLNDLDAELVDAAKLAAETLGLPWPPHLPAAENFLLDNRAWAEDPSQDTL